MIGLEAQSGDEVEMYNKRIKVLRDVLEAGEWWDRWYRVAAEMCAALDRRATKSRGRTVVGPPIVGRRDRGALKILCGPDVQQKIELEMWDRGGFMIGYV